MAKGNFVLVQLSNPEHIVCLQGISDDGQDFLYQDSDGTIELKRFPIARITHAQVYLMDEEHEGKAIKDFRFPAARRLLSPKVHSSKVRKMLEAAHNEARESEGLCTKKLNFEKDNRIVNEDQPNRWERRHMYDVGHVLEFKRTNSSTELGAEANQSGVIIEDFDARFEHEISVKIGDQVQVTNG